MTKIKIGLIINPIAGMGGKVGLKGTDGREIYLKALDSGAVPEAPNRAAQAIKPLEDEKSNLCFVTCSGEMGERVVREAGFEFEVIGKTITDFTTPEDTEEAALAILASGVDFLMFAGGDGTARNIYNAVGMKLPVIGVPSGVKMHSAVFGSTPRNAGSLASLYVKGQINGTHEAEVMDINEAAFRNQRVSARLYGYLMVPRTEKLLQNVKAGRAAKEDDSAKAIAFDVIKKMDDDSLYIIGPGTTTRAIMEQLQLPNTLLGVDVVQNKQLVANDVNEQRLLEIIEDKPARIVVTIIGGQGYIFGRGNQQISARVIKKVGANNITVIATKNKIFALRGAPLLVDTGDDEIDRVLSGYIPVVTGLKEQLVCKVC